MLDHGGTVHLSRYTTRKRALKSHRLSETPIVWGNTSDLFTLRGLDIIVYRANELKESDGELRCSCLRRQPACLQPCARLITAPTSLVPAIQVQNIKLFRGVSDLVRFGMNQQSDRRLSTMNPLLTPRYVGASVCASTHSCIK